MHPLIAELLAHGPVVTDGAWGTQLQARGLAIGEFPDAWNLTFPDRVEAVARENAQVFDALPANGVAVLPSDDAFTPLWRELVGARRVVTGRRHR